MLVALGRYTGGDEVYKIDSSNLRQGDNQVAIHCHQTSGGQFIDFGFVVIVPAKSKK
ncbi:hypothetical protein NHH03_22960 [Stieleria sp. TO1_6]|uniref:hypothetical protein n=1 Tax=Stieleria tagensis TaxID=2956795 RepID=UPI00209AFA03|nr:hypothetical protein [Stieleria tagensis]MCO8124617.1 hypothetical protein [Stieleria tagensis]